MAAKAVQPSWIVISDDEKHRGNGGLAFGRTVTIQKRKEPLCPFNDNIFFLFFFLAQKIKN